MTLSEAKHVCLLGIAGAGMRSLARLLANRDVTISGTDFNLEALQDPRLQSYELLPETDAVSLVNQADLVIYSDALPPDHPLRVSATELGKSQYSYQQAIGELSSEYQTIAITGTHGKSSTTAFLGHILTEAGLDPTVLIGASVPNWGGEHGRIGQSSILIVEADEYRDHFLHLIPTHILITSIDFDHPDFFHSTEHVLASYQKFIQRLPITGKVFLSAVLQAAYPQLVPASQTEQVPAPPSSIPLVLPGEHMQQNAWLAAQAAHTIFGISLDKACAHLATFQGLGRRFETVGVYQGMSVLSDYGHHPTEIAATLKATRQQFKTQKILALFEPHTSERLTTFMNEFIATFQEAPIDGLLVCPIFKAVGREHEDTATSAAFIKKLSQVAPYPIQSIEANEDLLPKLRELPDHYDILIGFSAGSLDTFLRRLVD